MVSWLSYSATVKMEVIVPSETLIDFHLSTGDIFRVVSEIKLYTWRDGNWRWAYTCFLMTDKGEFIYEEYAIQGFHTA
jgi:hypothetical protein